MDKQEIIEGNKLIANFDPRLKPDKSDSKKETWDLVDPKDGGWLHVSHLKYHEDWNQLMPVVEKIETLDRNSIQFYIKDRRAYVERDTQASMAFDLPDLPECYSGFCDSKILAVYSTVIQFIKWYNSQKQ